ncbi:hypothetical protein HJG60_012005 [Phyllostomus discolor]|uniref:Uncharacterized protein n=1 Tax=Phyllostomus discolor TaxID=89673 RepID=A0A833ZJ47_9CHIR|nr:hypothetical protein HJG60_012005 [Phyllostomus discolor]
MLAADILASHGSLFGSQRVSNECPCWLPRCCMISKQVEGTASRSPSDCRTNVRARARARARTLSPLMRSRTIGSLTQENTEGLAGLRASQTSGLSTAQDKKLVESLRSKSWHEHKGQVPPENLFKKGMKVLSAMDPPQERQRTEKSPTKRHTCTSP